MGDVGTPQQVAEPMPRAARAGWRWLPLSRRLEALELLDAGRLDDHELRTNLGDLARLNRLPGGAGASLRAVAALVGGRDDVTVLDVGTGAGDLPLAFASRGWQAVALDADPKVAAIARERTAGEGLVTILEADADALPFADGAFDVVHASLLVHHLDPQAATAALREMARVARVGVVLNDLRRGLLPLLATAVAVAALGRCRATRHDGLLSVRRAYTLPELDGLLHAAGLHVVRRTAGWMPRVVTTAVAGAVR